MKVYSSLNVELGYQPNGTKSLIVLSGPQNEIEQAFNGLFLHGATNNPNAIDWQNEEKDLATFWSSERKMRKFWRGHALNSGKRGAKVNAFVSHKMTEMFASGCKFANLHVKLSIDYFNIGTKSAERPDYNGREAFFALAS